MTSRIPPRSRSPVTLDYYTKGEYPNTTNPSRFKVFAAEPSVANPLSKRSPPKTSDLDIKPAAPFIRSGGYLPGIFSDRGEHHTPERNPSSLAEVRLLQSKEYTNQSREPRGTAARTVSSSEYSQRKVSAVSNHVTPIRPTHFYPSKPQRHEYDRPKNLHQISPCSPDWFQPRSQSCVKSPDETITVVSRIFGWSTVTPPNLSRKNRLENRSEKQPMSIVSNLAPSWMQKHRNYPQKQEQFQKDVGHPCIRQTLRRTYLVDTEQPSRSVFSIGDYRHNVRTADEAREYSKHLHTQPKQMFEWKEDVSKQSYDKPVTAKIGY